MATSGTWPDQALDHLIDMAARGELTVTLHTGTSAVPAEPAEPGRSYGSGESFLIPDTEARMHSNGNSFSRGGCERQAPLIERLLSPVPR